MHPNIVSTTFTSIFSARPDIVVRAPGRINLIGEHTDYNGGLVLPAAIDKAIWFAAGKRNDRRFAFYAADLNEHFISEHQPLVFQKQFTWVNYLLGVFSEARKDGLEFGGLNLAFGGNVPLGAGLSSSAALESGAMFVLDALYGLGLSQLDIIRLAQRGENNFVGMQCGIMDMFASVMGRAGNVIKLDCRSLDYEYIPFRMPDHSLVLCDSGVKHALVASEYNTRRRECEEGVAILKRYYPDIASLRDVSTDLLKAHENQLRPSVYNRCLYVVEEIARVEQACTALRENDLRQLGRLMYQTHDGLDRAYEVSCPELNFMVNAARVDDAVTGSRMMGGGFGGCTINLVKNEAVEAFTQSLDADYQRVFSRKINSYVVRPSNGIEVVD
ncbi:MAG: galactokinase [Lewinellaceae bacterium]|nr:galactokinase [Lewinellaceae bacterium]